MSRYFVLPGHHEVILKSSPPSQELCAYPECPHREEGYNGKKLLLCARCKEVQYCDKSCQAPHWKAEHKAQCTGGVQQLKAWLDPHLAMIKWAAKHALQVDTTDKILDHYLCVSNQQRGDDAYWLNPAAFSRFNEALCRKMDDVDFVPDLAAEVFSKNVEETKRLRAEGGMGEAIAVIIMWPFFVIEKIRFDGQPEPRPKYNRSWSPIIQGVLNGVIEVPAGVLDEAGGIHTVEAKSVENGDTVQEASEEIASDGAAKEAGAE